MERAKWRWLEWLKAHGYNLSEIDRLWSGFNFLKPGTVKPWLLDPMYHERNRVLAENLPTQGRIFLTLGNDVIGGGTHLFSEAPGYDVDAFPMVNPSGYLSFDATKGHVKTDSGSADYFDLNALAPAIVTALGAGKTLTLFTVAEKNTGGSAFHFRFQNGTKYGLGITQSGEVFGNTIRDDVPNSYTNYITGIGGVNEPVIGMVTWYPNGDMVAHAIGSTAGNYATASNSPGGAYTWMSGIDTVRLASTAAQKIRAAAIYVGNDLQVTDFFSMARFSAEWARDEGIVQHLLLRQNAAQWFYTWIDSTYTLTAAWAKVTGWATASIQATEAFSFASDEVTIQDPGVYKIEVACSLDDDGDPYAAKFRLAVDTGGGYGAITDSEAYADVGGSLEWAHSGTMAILVANAGDKVCVQGIELIVPPSPPIVEKGQFIITRLA